MDDNRFILVFISAVTLTALTGLTMGALALYGPDPQPPPIAALFDTLALGFSGGLLTIYSLLRLLGRRPVAKQTSRVRSRRRST
jgi:hypothetical protein